MDRSAYDHMEAIDQKHWWYVARRQVLEALIARETDLPKDARVLEVGCGTGHNFAMLSGFGAVDAVELDDHARSIAEGRLGRGVHAEPLPEMTGVKRRHYDLAGAFDVIEHVDDDAAAVAAIASCLKPGGTFVMTVPGHQWMWSAHDVVNHHKRRYSKAQLRALIDGSPLKLERIGWFNSLLFPLAVAERMASKARGKDEAHLGIPPAPVNAAFRAAFAAERHFIGRLPLPVGLSLFAVASAT